MNTRLSISLLILAATVAPLRAADIREASGIDGCPIKTIVEKCYPQNLYIGIATQHKLLDSLSGEIADREFGYITPANDFKQSYIHPAPGKWQWKRSDEFLSHCSANGQMMRVHGPISPQCSAWVRDDDRTNQELDAMLDEYFIALCRHIDRQPSVKWMDVVNETVCKNRINCKKYGTYEPGDWFGPRQGDNLWENPWLALGYDSYKGNNFPTYIRRAFEISNKYAPNVKQIINQHGDFNAVEWDKIKSLVEYLRSRGLRVDGLGWQAHINTGWEKTENRLRDLDSFITWCHANGLEFHITEMNVWINRGDTETDQAATFKAVFDTVIPHCAQGPTAICFWNVRDEDTDKAVRQGTLWRNDGTPRPGYFALRESLAKNALTRF